MTITNVENIYSPPPKQNVTACVPVPNRCFAPGNCGCWIQLL